MALPLGKASALTGSEFQAGRIIDDDKFFNGSTMSSGEIQAFLNAKILNGSCDTYGSKPYGSTTRAAYGASQGNPAPYVCLKGYSQNTSTRPAETGLCNQYNGGTKSAAQIIYDVGQACGVSQKALLVLLEKEQSLISDDWPWPRQYSAATGFGCPDTAPCDEEFGAFFDQVYYAARQFKMYGYKSNLFGHRAYRDTFVRYNPSESCSGSNVYLQNQATAGLYNYTPYQPNAAALANLNGTGDSCSAYGNRNFWKLYNDWFGTTTVSYAQNSTYAKSACNIPSYNSDQVGRMYNAETRDYLFTTSRFEACLAIKAGYIWDGIRFANYVPSSDTTPVYRLVNYTRHLYTTSPAVKQDYMANRGYRDEGIAFYAKTSSTSPNIAVNCYVRDETVVYTSATGEGMLLAQEGYYNVGLAFYTGQLPNSNVNLYRLNQGPHRLYATDEHERDVAQLFYGFTFETNETAIVKKNPAPDLAPVYRLSAPNRHFYTTHRGERDLAVIYYGYRSEGTEFYAYPTQVAGTIPVYRLTDLAGNRLYTKNAVEKQLAIEKYGYTSEAIGWYINP